jgi:outer membrane biosynthesis protein TonB
VKRRELSPAFVGSLALHGVALTLLMISWRFSHELKIGTAVPVTIVANAPDTDLRAAEQAPQEQTAQTETPVAEAPPQAAPPAPQPAPTPPAPAPVPAKPQKVVEKPTPQKTQAPVEKPEKQLDLDALAASLAKSVTAKPSSASKGATRPETALQARPAAGTGLSAAAMSGLADELQRRWNPNCDVEGGRDVVVKVAFQLGAGGNVTGDVSSQILHGGPGAVARAAADRAVRAVYAASPFRALPREFYGQRITVNFNAREACS